MDRVLCILEDSFSVLESVEAREHKPNELEVDKHTQNWNQDPSLGVDANPVLICTVIKHTLLIHETKPNIGHDQQEESKEGESSCCILF